MNIEYVIRGHWIILFRIQKTKRFDASLFFVCALIVFVMFDDISNVSFIYSKSQTLTNTTTETTRIIFVCLFFFCFVTKTLSFHLHIQQNGTTNSDTFFPLNKSNANIIFFKICKLRIIVFQFRRKWKRAAN